MRWVSSQSSDKVGGIGKFHYVQYEESAQDGQGGHAPAVTTLTILPTTVTESMVG